MYYDLLHEFIDHVQKTHRKYKFETDFRVLAQKLNIGVAYYPYNTALTYETFMPIISINYNQTPERMRFAGMHEIAHVMLYDCGVEDELINLIGGDPEDAEMFIEKFCNVAAGYLLTPYPMVHRALDRWDYTPMAVLDLSRMSKASLQTALRRLVHLDDTASVAGLLTSGQTVLDLSKHRFKIPLRTFQVLPDSHPLFSAPVGRNATINIDERTDLLVTRIHGTRKCVGLYVATW